MKPQRIQLSRRKGFDLQAVSLALNGLPAVNVARPSQWGNPYRVVSMTGTGSYVVTHPVHGIVSQGTNSECINYAVGYFSAMIMTRPRETFCAMVDALHGKNLACWCAPGAPCHADVLLELAAATMPAFTERERHVMEHATGWLSDSPLYRNRFHAPKGHADRDTLVQLCKRGFVRHPIPDLFVVMMEGIRSLSELPGQPKRTPKQTERLQALIAANMEEAP